MNEDTHSRQPRVNGADPDRSFFKSLRGFIRRLLRRRNGNGSVREKLEELIEEGGNAETPIDVEERTLLANVLSLSDRTVADVMVPRADIVAIEIGATMEALTKLITKEGHSRIPVFRGTLDDALGMVHIKDVMAARTPPSRVDLGKIVRDILFVAPSMQVLELRLEMRVKKTHMALVVDEFGGIDGLVTIEDLVEEIVGEIEDEHDREVTRELDFRADGSLDADARMPIEKFEELAGPILLQREREEVETLGGLVFFLAGRVPIKGELIIHASGLEIEILEADPRRVKRLRLRGLPHGLSHGPPQGPPQGPPVGADGNGGQSLA